MPTYEYACKQCGHRFETVQSMKDEPLKTCPTCGGELRRVLHAAGLVFKGSGFYATDNRAKPKESTSASDGKKDGDSGSESGKKESGSKEGSSSGSGDSGGSGSKDSSGDSKTSSGSGGSGDGSGGSKKPGSESSGSSGSSGSSTKKKEES